MSTRSIKRHVRLFINYNELLADFSSNLKIRDMQQQLTKWTSEQDDLLSFWQVGVEYIVHF